MKWNYYKVKPNKSGRYLVTAITRSDRYVTLLDFSLDVGWHDLSHKSSLSHVVLAWCEIEPCKCNYNFDNILFGVSKC